ncbi:MAG: hypothetical protein ACKODH_10930 [Limisphaerales bacterium]
MKASFLIASLAILIWPRHANGVTPPFYACQANLKQIDGAVQQWALERNLSGTNTYSLDDLAVLAYLKGSVLPTCPTGGRYSSALTVADSPRCSLHGDISHPIDAEHALETRRVERERFQKELRIRIAIFIALCCLIVATLVKAQRSKKHAG